MGTLVFMQTSDCVINDLYQNEIFVALSAFCGIILQINK